MNLLRQSFLIFFALIRLLLKYVLTRLWEALPVVRNWIVPPGVTDSGSCKADTEEWKTNATLREYHSGGADESRVTVQTSTHAFSVSKNNRSPNSTCYTKSDMLQKLGFKIHF